MFVFDIPCTCIEVYTQTHYLKYAVVSLESWQFVHMAVKAILIKQHHGKDILVKEKNLHH